MENMLNEIILGNWGGIRLNAKIDEELKDIILAIQYNDHGDDFLLIRTKKNTYEYGWWLNRKHEPEYDDLYNGKCDWEGRFVRRPELFHKFDYRCRLSNEIYRKFYDNFEKDYFRNKNLNNNADMAQRKFDRFIRYMEQIEHRGVIYHADDYKQELMIYLVQHNISTKENIAKLDKVKWNSRINGSDGIAGKRLYECDRLYGDSIKFIYYKGKEMDVSKVKKKFDTDEWGAETFSLSFKQFK